MRRISSRVFSATPSEPLSAAETVEMERPACSATVLIVTLPPRPRGSFTADAFLSTPLCLTIPHGPQEPTSDIGPPVKASYLTTPPI